jgi:hypothetical protein
VQWRSRKLRIRVMQATGSVEATLERGEPMKLVVGGKIFNLDRSETLRVSIDPKD